MTVSTTAAIVVAVANGSTTVFNFSFEIPYQSDGVTPAVTVYSFTSAGVITNKVLNTDYTIANVANPAGGSITFGTAPAAGWVVTKRSLSPVQPDSFPNYSLEPSAIEAALDFNTYWSQQYAVAALTPPGPYTVATLPSTPIPGQWAWVTDATALTWGVAVTGGGSYQTLVQWINGGWVVK